MFRRNKMASKRLVVLEVAANKYDVDQITEKAVADYKKNNKAALKDINVYIKPEDGKAYYTANGGKISGSVDI